MVHTRAEPWWSWWLDLAVATALSALIALVAMAGVFWAGVFVLLR